MPTLTLARVVYKENVSAFKDVDDARTALRYIEGKAGARNKKYLKDKSLIMEQPRPYNPYKLPESDEREWTPYDIVGVKKLAVFSDIHVPYHSISALTPAIDFIVKEECDGLLLNGDTIDFHGLSRFMKDPRKRSVAHELQACNELLDVFCGLGLKIFFKMGNHDERYQHYLMQKAPELLGIREFELEYLLKLKERGIEFITDKRIVRANKLNILHGHEFVGGISAPVNIARGLFLRAKVSAMQGHNHQGGSHSEANLNGELITTWSLGCLCELHPEYMPINKWNHGFAIVYLHEDGKQFQVKNFSIYKGAIY
jgi:hypothetical protein